MESNSSTPDMKYDGGKILAAAPFQDFPDAMQELCKVSTMGINKYRRHSWREVSDAEGRYTDALARHFLASFPEFRDEESNLPHLAHLAWNALCVLQLALEEQSVR